MQSGRDNLKQQVYFVQKKTDKADYYRGGAVDSNNACSGLAMIIRPPRRPPQLQDNAIKGRRFRGIEYNTKAIQNVLKTSHTQYYF